MRKSLYGLVLLAFAAPAHAQDIEKQIILQLRAQGFGTVEVSRTLLGRSRIVARSPALRREIVVNPNTGHILRDYTVRTGDGATVPSLLSPGQDDEGGVQGDTEGDDGQEGSDGEDSGESDDGDGGEGNDSGEGGDNGEGDDGGEGDD